MWTAEELITLLDLKPLPREGGFYRETYRSSDCWPAGSLSRFPKEKSAATAIYYLLTPDTFSALHRLPTDEIFHFYLGDPVSMLQLRPDGTGRIVTLGPELRRGQQLQVVVPRGVWQGSFLAPGGKVALLGTTMAPGFDFDDYEPGQRANLLRQYPLFGDIIRRLTPDEDSP
ncbi:MAG: cupin domain-containing protein [Gemmataceae bacterium]|nr:cupin domain-containing protein [Gemmataceae bacterium]